MNIRKKYPYIKYIFCLYFIICSGATTFAVNRIKIPHQDNVDFTTRIREILENNKPGNIVLEFEEGVYHFYPEKAEGLYICVSNNDNGYKRVAFNLSGMKNVRIEGAGAEFMFHGSIVPFYINEARDISISGINMDYDYSFIFEGEVVANDPAKKTFDIRVSNDIQYRIKSDRLYFGGYDWELPAGENIVFDPETRAPYYRTQMYHHAPWRSDLLAESIGDSLIRLQGDMKEVPPVGSIYTDKGPHGRNRVFPGIILHSSSGISLEKINIYMSGAMALIAENTENVTLREFNVRLRPGSNRIISASADATHFVNCRGLVHFENCLFENMLDDATNVHGTYMKVTEVSGDRLAVQFGHYQQEGFRFARKGDTLRLIDSNTLLPVHTFTAKDIQWVNHNYGLIYADSAFPELEKSLAVENLSNCAAMIMKNCTVRNNRARSILISTNKPVLVEGNYFDSMMAGVLIAGDANKWCESGNVSDVVIRDNTFVNIGKGGGKPQSVLQISPEIAPEYRGKGYYHGRVVFENNMVRTFDAQVIYGLGVEDLVIRNNTFIQSRDYAPIFDGLSFFDFQYCKSVDIEGNSFAGDYEAEVSARDCEKISLKRQKGFHDKVVENPNRFFYRQ